MKRATVMLTGITFRGGVPTREHAERWAETVRGEYPNQTGDTAAKQVIIALTMTLGGFQLFISLEGDKLVGLLAYRIERKPDRIELFNFAVLPAYQRRGIGVELLEQVKTFARGKLPIFASGINDPAFVPLQRAGFWKVKDRGIRNTTYKWSDLPEHQNDDTPFKKDDKAR